MHCISNYSKTIAKSRFTGPLHRVTDCFEMGVAPLTAGTKCFRKGMRMLTPLSAALKNGTYHGNLGTCRRLKLTNTLSWIFPAGFIIFDQMVVIRRVLFLSIVFVTLGSLFSHAQLAKDKCKFLGNIIGTST